MASKIEQKIREASSRNEQLLVTLRETASAGPSLEEQERRIAGLRSAIDASKDALRRLDQRRKEELRYHASHRDSVMRRWAYAAVGKKDEFAARAAREECGYLEALQREHHGEERRQQLDGMLADATRAREELQTQRAHRQQAQGALDRLYDSVFAGPSPGFPEEDEMESIAHAALQTYHDAHVTAEAESEAIRSLADAALEMQAARAAMRDALRKSRVDLYTGGTMRGTIEREALGLARQHVLSSQRMVDQAMRLSSHVPPLPPVRIPHEAGRREVFVGVVFHEQVRQCLRDVDTCADAVQWNLNSARNRHARLLADRDLKAQSLENARQMLQKIREKAMRRVTEAGSLGLREEAEASEEKLWESEAIQEVM